jgi:hypothetical protein
MSDDHATPRGRVVRADQPRKEDRMTAPVPVAEIIGQRSYGGIRTVRILCPSPSCGRTHVHRWADAGTPVVGSCGAVYTIGHRTERTPL